MKKNKFVITCLLTGMLLAPAVNADGHQSYLSGFTSKVSQGFFNMAGGILELPKNIVNISSEQNILLGMSWGLLRGVAHTVDRTLIGAVEFISAPIPSDEFISPAYPWERFSEDTRYFGLHLPGYWTHYGPLDDGE
ncbi:exosortase system-associated protein, TIGR04073 family [Methylomonas sp. EFPC3]|uniref:exosortase system-associated protein, TIGR04073 family n=1 Tax=Methylomonas TaxID=416 RepID=UPI00112C93FD|nr:MULTISPECIES: exosortase system-associated protein, TIGR04073 family [Methylomonas]TPQ24546.1 exosortase system-associated protein, TIGR04073 family [Methylomonas koyamae]WFP49066.1 exosortase system-associated protein, TIGR04073 family [Methylomonas sp. EFPC3]